MSTGLTLFFALIVLFGALAAWFGRFSITMPIIFVFVGALMGPGGLVSASAAELLIEMTLALLLFADASALAFQVRDDPGLPIFGNPPVPVRVRRALNVESGLYDGIATTLVALFTAMALAHETTQGAGDWLLPTLGEIGIGAGVGIAAGLLGGWFFVTALKRGWTAVSSKSEWRRVFPG